MMNATSMVEDETLRMVAQAVADFARPNVERIRTVREKSQGFDRNCWMEFGEQGWLALLLPESLGGTALGIDAAAVIAKQLGYACYTEPFVGVAVAGVQCLLGCPTSRRRDQLLEAIGCGEKIAALAWQSADGVFDSDPSIIVSECAPNIVSLSGQARFVCTAHADVLIVSAKAQDELRLYAVPIGAPGVDVQHERAADGTLLAWVRLKDVVVQSADLLAQGDQANTALNAAIDAAVLCCSAELLGVIERSLEITLDYLKVRKQFGQHIGSFQALQHRAVDMWIQKSLTQAALRSAVDVFCDPESTPEECMAAASSVKARASQAALYVAGQSVQLHGAIGTTDEYELGVYVNRALSLAAQWGNAVAHRRRYGKVVVVKER